MLQPGRRQSRHSSVQGTSAYHQRLTINSLSNSDCLSGDVYGQPYLHSYLATGANHIASSLRHTPPIEQVGAKLRLCFPPSDIFFPNSKTLFTQLSYIESLNLESCTSNSHGRSEDTRL